MLDTSDKSGKSTDVASAKELEKTQDEEKMYSVAYQTFKEGNHDKARTDFLNYLAAYPNSEYSDNANFGLVMLFLNKNMKREFGRRKSAKNYPNGNKVPYALLKQGLSFLKVGDKTSANYFYNK